jgi:dihydrofolate reductase/thymidylate synthase
MTSINAKKLFNVIVARTTSTSNSAWQMDFPWTVPGYLRYFDYLTKFCFHSSKFNLLIMGRKTWESLPAACRPFPGRINVVVSFQPLDDWIDLYQNQAVFVSGFDQALQILNTMTDVGDIWVIGGNQLFNQAISYPECQSIYETIITQMNPPLASSEMKTLTPEENPSSLLHPWPSNIHLSQHKHIQDQRGYDWIYNIWGRQVNHDAVPRELPPQIEHRLVNSEENQYMQMVQNILNTGHQKTDRTGTGTLSQFGGQMKFDLKDYTLPLLTTKYVHFKSIVEELLWFIRGSTDTRELSQRGVKIWDANSSREFLDRQGLQHRMVGDVGPVYGFNWRHYGAAYQDMATNYQNQGVDQLQEVIHLIKTQPDSRRILMLAWNPTEIRNVALPPCHVLCQFYVNQGRLSCHMYQRSADLGLGVPFNIASYALLTMILSHICQLAPGELFISFGDVHIYIDHIEALKIQIQRQTLPFPRIHFTRTVPHIDDIKSEDIQLINYQHAPALKMKMSV